MSVNFSYSTHNHIFRFLPPIPKKPWSGVKDVRKVANSCVQIKGTAFGNFSGEQVISISFRFCISLLYPLKSDCCVWYLVSLCLRFSMHIKILDGRKSLNLNMSEDGIVPDTFWPWVQLSLSDAWLLYIVCQFIAPRQNVGQELFSCFMMVRDWIRSIQCRLRLAILPTMPTCLHYLSISLSNGGNKTLSSLYCIASQKGAHFIFYI